MSALFPTETNVEKPEAELGGLSHHGDAERAALRQEPDAARRRPGRRERAVQLDSGSVFTTPMQFGPIRRIPDARQTSTSSRWRASPSSPVSPNPAEITTSPRTPFVSRTPARRRGRRPPAPR